MSESPPYPHWLLRRSDQTAVAALVVLALAGTVIWWAIHAGWRENLVEIDQAEPLTAQFSVDINEADWPELMQLPGIGKTLAHRIVESRKTAGPFADINDLRRVQGIGPKIFERMRPYLRPLPHRRAGVGQDVISNAPSGP